MNFNTDKKTDDAMTIPWQERPAGSDELVWRDCNNPIINRNPLPKAASIYNVAVIPYNGMFVGIFRVDYKNGMPLLHFGQSIDGKNWAIETAAIDFMYSGDMPSKEEYGYDPRICKIEGTYYISWCSGYHGPTIGLASTKDFVNFQRLENAFLPFNRNGVLFPRKINGRYAMLSRPSDNGHTPFGDIFYSESPDLCFWGRHRFVMGTTKLWWETTKVGAGAIPLETKDGWLVFYHGVMSTCNGFVYSMGAVLLDLDKPYIVLARTKEYLLAPETEYETVGHVPNVVFPCAALCDFDTGRIAVYYGAADTYTCLAYTTIDNILSALKK